MRIRGMLTVQHNLQKGQLDMKFEVMVTSKGRITLPKAMRVALGLVPGTRLDFIRLQDGTVIIRFKHRKPEDSG